MKTLQRRLILALLFLSAVNLYAQRKERKNEFAVLFGLNQPLLVNGFNIEVNYFTPKFVFDYSHGISLDLKGDLVTEEMKTQKLVAHIPYSTGFGAGYRISKFFNLRIEPKWHKFEIYYEGEPQTESNLINAYTTFTLGLGLYGKWMPFDKKESFIRNIMIAPSVRFWPNLSTSLSDDEFNYENKYTGQTETQEALRIGVGNTPWIINVSVGYRF